MCAAAPPAPCTRLSRAKDPASRRAAQKPPLRRRGTWAARALRCRWRRGVRPHACSARSRQLGPRWASPRTASRCPRWSRRAPADQLLLPQQHPGALHARGACAKSCGAGLHSALQGHVTAHAQRATCTVGGKRCYHAAWMSWRGSSTCVSRLLKGTCCASVPDAQHRVACMPLLTSLCCAPGILERHRPAFASLGSGG
jgi:hypothetical protein